MDIGVVVLDILNGLARGFLYFLIASGLVVTLGTLGIINFSHGAFYMLGAYISWTIVQAIAGLTGSFWIGAVSGAASLFILGVLVERVLLRRIYAAEHLYQILLTFGIVLFIDGIVLELWGGLPKASSQPKYLTGNLAVMGYPWPIYYLFVLLFSVAATVALWILLYRTRFGRDCRAAAMDPEMSGALGINVPSVFTLMFAIGVAIAGIAGGVGTGLMALSPGLGNAIIILCFVIVVIGGMGSLGGALVGALIIGMLESFGWHYFPDMAMYLPYMLMAVILLIRPQGLFGKL